MKLYYSLLFLLSASLSYAQLWQKTAINIGYRYTGRNVLQAGLEFKTNGMSEQSVIAGVSMLYTFCNHEEKFLPEANIYYSSISGYLLGASLNPYAVEPRLGFSLFNFIYLNTGYALPIHRDKYFRGITFGVQLNIAPAKSTGFYDRLKVM
ncbi:hypothetical protein [Chryseobacterium gossypii]|uniref:hypothetical protein n=1 Tax=Chryseobacterium gossypii TaxID=3231602 RepID=UPI003526935C